MHFRPLDSVQIAGSTQPPIQWVHSYQSPVLKWWKRKANHSPPPNTEVKSAWNYTSTGPYVFMAQYLMKQERTFNFKLYLPKKNFLGFLNEIKFAINHGTTVISQLRSPFLYKLLRKIAKSVDQLCHVLLSVLVAELGPQ
jgi:hypothetical protein